MAVGQMINAEFIFVFPNEFLNSILVKHHHNWFLYKDGLNYIMMLTISILTIGCSKNLKLNLNILFTEILYLYSDQ